MIENPHAAAAAVIAAHRRDIASGRVKWVNAAPNEGECCLGWRSQDDRKVMLSTLVIMALRRGSKSRLTWGDLYVAIEDALEEAVGNALAAAGFDPLDVSDYEEWNDQPDRTQAEVMAVLNTAAAFARSNARGSDAQDAL